jgi:predicted enzyme related to lactoylglutathione lyase
MTVDPPRDAMPPTLGHGKICYIELPATDVGRSAAFYRDVFGWCVRVRDDGSTAFDDGVGEVSGTWRTDRPPAAVPGVLVHVMVDDIAAAVEAVIAHGGQVAEPISGSGREQYARIIDPGGNSIGLFQQ